MSKLKAGLKKIVGQLTMVRRVQLGIALILMAMLISSLLISLNVFYVTNQLEEVTDQTVPATRVNSNLSVNLSQNLMRFYRASAGYGDRYEQDLVSRELDRLEQLVSDEEMEGKLENMRELNQELRAKQDQLLAGEGTNQVVANQIENLVHELEILNAQITKTGWEGLEREIREVQNLTVTMRNRVLMLGGFILILGILLGVLVTKGMSKITSLIKDETQQATNKAENITNLAEKIKQSTDEVETKLTTAFGAIKELLDGNGEVSQAIEEVAGSIQGIARSTEKVAEQAEQISTIGDDTYQTMEEVTDKIKVGNRLVNQVVERMEKLENQIGNIDKISNRIMQIAEQTNLLALNAAIEAARANKNTEVGSSNQGFTVVAEEIKELANESKQATKEVQTITTEITKAAQQTISVIKNETEESNTDVVGVFTEIDKLADAALQQTKTIKQFADKQEESTEKVSTLTQEISASSEEVAAQSEQTVTSSQQLKEIVEEITRANTDLYTKANEQVKNCSEQEELIKQIVEANSSLK